MSLPGMNAAASLGSSAMSPVVMARPPVGARPAARPGAAIQRAMAESPLKRFLRTNGWTKGAGPNYYFPNNYPHLHAGLNGDNLQFLAYSYGTGVGTIQVVQNGYYIRGTLPQVDAAARNDYPGNPLADQISEQADLLVNQFAALPDVRPVARGAIPPATVGSPASLG